MHSHPISGLKARHPLGFLAACGLLRCLSDTGAEGALDCDSMGIGRVALGWREDGGEEIAVIRSEFQVDTPVILKCVTEVANRQRHSKAWNWSRKIDERSKYVKSAQSAVDRLLGKESTRCDADMFAALASDLVFEKDALRRTAFDLTSGNQGFLKSLKQTAERFEKGAERDLDEALDGQWRHRADDHSLGWDPQTQRLHALRGTAPEGDRSNRSVRAAVLLGSLALPLFPCFAVGRALRTTGFHDDGRQKRLSWPIWRDPISLSTLKSLLSHPFNNELRDRGVHVVYQCAVVQTGGSSGRYEILSHSTERSWV